MIENKGAYRLLYVKGRPVRRESDLQLMYRLTWYGTRTDISREVNDGRGPADFKSSLGSEDKTIIEMKLARNPKLRQNLIEQTEVYKKASDAKRSVRVIVYFSAGERRRVEKILKEVGLPNDESIVLIDARQDNKPSGSRA